MTTFLFASSQGFSRKGVVMVTLLRKELLEQWRTYRILIVCAVLLFFGLSSPLLARYTPEILKSLPGVPPELANILPPATVADAVGQYLENIIQFGVILALLISMGAVIQEKERGTAAILLSKPVSRETFLLAKFISIDITFIFGLFLASIGAYYYAGLLFEWLSFPRFIAMNGLVYVYLTVYVALTVLASTMARSQVAAGGIAFGLLVTMGIAGAIPRLGSSLPGELIAWGGRVALGDVSNPAWSALWVSLGLILTALLGAWAIFRRQEI